MYFKKVTDQTVPDLECLFENSIRFDSHPADWFDLCFPIKRVKDTHPKAVAMDDITAWRNIKAFLDNKGSRWGKYARFKYFTKPELMSHLLLHILHTMSPSPRVEMKLKSETDDPINGSTLCKEVYGKSGVTQHKEFK